MNTKLGATIDNGLMAEEAEVIRCIFYRPKIRALLHKVPGNTVHGSAPEGQFSCAPAVGERAAASAAKGAAGEIRPASDAERSADTGAAAVGLGAVVVDEDPAVAAVYGAFIGTAVSRRRSLTV